MSLISAGDGQVGSIIICGGGGGGGGAFKQDEERWSDDYSYSFVLPALPSSDVTKDGMKRGREGGREGRTMGGRKWVEME